MKAERRKELEILAAKVRRDITEAVITAGCGHPGGSLSSTDIMTALFFEFLKIDPKNPGWEDRDRFILSKGHRAVGLFSVMSQRGFISREKLMTFRQDGSSLGGHPDMLKVPGVEMSTGSLGHGLSVGIGMALGARLSRKAYRVFVLLGDGETQEGSVWEAALSASTHKLDHLTAIIDRNGLQIDGATEGIVHLEPFKEKWESFGWAVKKINGHSFDEIDTAFSSLPFEKGKPSLIIAETVKGKGVSFMENSVPWHGGAPKGELAVQARREVQQKLDSLL